MSRPSSRPPSRSSSPTTPLGTDEAPAASGLPDDFDPEALIMHLSSRNEDAVAALFMSALEDRDSACRLLSHELDASGDRVLHRAAYLGLTRILKSAMLVWTHWHMEQGEEEGPCSIPVPLLLRNASNITPLHVAAGHPSAAELLVEAASMVVGDDRGALAELLAVTDSGGRTPLDHAIELRCWKSAEVFRAAGARCKVVRDPSPLALTLDPPEEDLRKFREPRGLQFCSDLHLEFFHSWDDISVESILVPTAPYLALVGDIAIPTDPRRIYQEFIRACSERFVAVFVMAGNHEYYHSSLLEAEAAMHSACAEHDNVYFLTTCRLTLFQGALRVLATSRLWSHIPPHAEDQVHRSLNDFRIIRLGPDRSNALTPAHVNRMHGVTLHWLTEEVVQAREDGVRLWVMSHWAPTFIGTSAPEHRTPLHNVINYAFASNLEHFFKDFAAEQLREANSTVEVWVYGHTHWNPPKPLVLHGTRILSNQRGYINEGQVPGYRPDAVVVFEAAREGGGGKAAAVFGGGSKKWAFGL